MGVCYLRSKNAVLIRAVINRVFHDVNNDFFWGTFDSEN